MNQKANQQHKNFVDTIREHAAFQPHRTALTFLEDGETETASLTYEELDTKARSIAAFLQGQGLANQRLLLLYPPSLDFLTSLLGCMYAGVVAVPAYPPEPHRLEHTLRRMQSIVADAGCDKVLTNANILGFAEVLVGQVSDETIQAMQWLTVEEALEHPPETWESPSLTQESVAFLQYTSGSTSAPKGVCVTHKVLSANLEMQKEVYNALGSDEVCLSWLPQYHDLGLLGLLLHPLYNGGRAVFMPPYAFIKKPSRWLELVTRYKATTTASPNFGFELCLRKVTPEQRDQLDLSSLRIVVSGAEPINPKTCERFLQFFAPCGLKREAFGPSYGLAEAVVFVSTRDRSRPIQYLSVEQQALEQGKVNVTDRGQDHSVVLVGCGQPHQDASIHIVNPETLEPVPSDTVGEIWVSGPQVTEGYWNNPEATKRSFGAHLEGVDGSFLRTGDLGFLHNNELYIVGRLQDLIIVRGRNLYPHDIERSMDALRYEHPAVRLGCSAAFSILHEEEEQLVVFQEIDDRKLKPEHSLSEIVSSMRRATLESHSIAPHAICLLERNTLPKTSSGKIMRQACKKAFLSNFVDSGIEVLHQQQGLVVEATTSKVKDVTTEPVEEQGDAPSSELMQWIVGWIADYTGLPKEEISPDADFPTFGLDSVDAIQFLGDLESKLDRVLATSVLWDHSTVRELALYLENS